MVNRVAVDDGWNVINVDLTRAVGLSAGIGGGMERWGVLKREELRWSNGER